MEKKFYNILWIDDEHDGMSGFVGDAKFNGIKLIAFKSLNEGMSELKKNYPIYDGVLLDAKFFENEDDLYTEYYPEWLVGWSDKPFFTFINLMNYHTTRSKLKQNSANTNNSFLITTELDLLNSLLRLKKKNT